MRLRVFRAPRMAEAMALVRAELGEDAVILGTRRVAEGVEVTAAQDAPDPVLILPDAPRPGDPRAREAAGPGPADRGREDPAALAHHRLPEGLAARLGAGPLRQALEEALAFAPLPDGRARPLLLAGPPGAGKTLTCAKLATRAVLGGARPLVVTTDTARAGAAEQLAAFTRLLGLPLALAGEPGTLAKAIRAHRGPGQPVLIDTAGCNPFAEEEASALLALARLSSAEIVLVLPGGLDPVDAAELARGFALLGARHLLPTRLDQARRLGGVLAAAEAAGLPLTEAGVGAAVTEEALAPITPDWLAERLRRGGAPPASPRPTTTAPADGGPAPPPADGSWPEGALAAAAARGGNAAAILAGLARMTAKGQPR